MVVEEGRGRSSKNLTQIGRAHRPLGTIDGIGSDEILTISNLEDDVGLTLLDVLYRFSVSCLLSTEDEIVGGSNLLYQSLRVHGVVDVNHIHHDVLHFHLHHPRHHAHDHDGESYDESRQKRIATYL